MVATLNETSPPNALSDDDRAEIVRELVCVLKSLLTHHSSEALIGLCTVDDASQGLRCDECTQMKPMKETYVGVKNYCDKQRVKALCLTCARLAKYFAAGWYPRRGDGTCCHDVKRHLCLTCEGASICFLSDPPTRRTLCLKGHLEGHGHCGGSYSRSN